MGFKDLMKSFLYENVEDDDDDEEEEELSSSTSSKPADQPAASAPRASAPAAPAPGAVQSEAPDAGYAQPAAPVQERPANLEAYYTQPKVSTPTAPEASQGSFLNRIDTDLTEPEPVRSKKQRSGRIHPVRTTPRTPLPRPNYAAVISPIFGNLPDAEKNPSALHDAINLPKPADTFDMVEIISPMYGTSPAQTKEASGPSASKARLIEAEENSEPSDSKAKKAAPSKAQPADAQLELPAPEEDSQLALPAPVEETEPEETPKSRPEPSDKPAVKKQNADLSAYLSRGVSSKPSGKSGRNSSKSKKGGRSR